MPFNYSAGLIQMYYESVSVAIWLNTKKTWFLFYMIIRAVQLTHSFWLINYKIIYLYKIMQINAYIIECLCITINFNTLIIWADIVLDVP